MLLPIRAFCAGLILFLAGACATPPAPASTETADRQAFSAEGLTALEASMKAFVDDGHVPGIATLLVKDGAEIHRLGYGQRNVETGAPVAEDTIYRIYSMTKPVTGVAMMQLYEQGKWKLDDPVTKFIPEFADLKVLAGQDASGNWLYEPVNRPPTLQEVMSHTAGFAYGLSGDDPANSTFRESKILRSPDLETMIARVAEVPLVFQPGTSWAYSAAVDIQGALVQRISGQSFGEYLDENIFTPLGMDDTGFYVPADDYDRFSQVFGYNPENGALVPVPYPEVAYRKETVAMESGGGGLVSTMDDYTAFSQMLLNGGSLNGEQILKPETVTLMRTNVLPDGMVMWSSGNFSDYDASGLGFGLGFGIITDPSVREAGYGEGTYFWGGAAGTWFWIDPENDLFFIGMIQRFDRGAPETVDFRTDSAKLVYEALGD